MCVFTHASVVSKYMGWSRAQSEDGSSHVCECTRKRAKFKSLTVIIKRNKQRRYWECGLSHTGAIEPTFYREETVYRTEGKEVNLMNK